MWKQRYILLDSSLLFINKPGQVIQLGSKISKLGDDSAPIIICNKHGTVVSMTVTDFKKYWLIVRFS